jgi:HptB-dependent secretion and biofilm anti anti-sigma factor
MSVKATVPGDGKEATISVSGRFDFDLHAEFRKALDTVRKNNSAHVTVDLGAVEDMDSSALGMLLLLRDTLGGDKAHVKIVRCRPEIRDMLVMANFQGMFQIT